MPGTGLPHSDRRVPVTNLYRGRSSTARLLLNTAQTTKRRIVWRRHARVDQAAPVRQGRVVVTTPETSYDSWKAYAMPRRCCSCLVCPCLRRAQHGRHGPRRQTYTSKCGCRARTPIARFHPARTAKVRARRANIKFRPMEPAKPVLHTLNGSGGRGPDADRDSRNYQQKDGTVVIPSLRPFMGGRRRSK